MSKVSTNYDTFYGKRNIKNMSNVNDFMYNWIREKSGRVKLDNVTTNDSGSNDNTAYSTHSIEIDYCTKHHIRLNNDGMCNVCNELNNK